MSVNDRLMKALEEYGGKTLNERIYHFLGSLGFTNSLSDRLAKYVSGRYRGYRALIEDLGRGSQPWENLFAEGQSLHFDLLTQRYGIKSPTDGSVTYTTNVNDLGIVTRASTATYWGPEGSLLEAAVDEARIQHDPVTGEPLGLLVESEATNLVVDSRYPDQGLIGCVTTREENQKFGSVLRVTAFDEPGGSFNSIRFSTPSMSARTGIMACSYYVKPLTWWGLSEEANYYLTVRFMGTQFTGRFSAVHFNPVTMEVLPDANHWEGGFLSGWAEDAGEGWFRVCIVLDTDAGTYQNPLFAFSRSYLDNDISASRITRAEGQDNVLITGVQWETLIQTSYIPTSDSPVTRAADNAVIDLSDVFNPDEGTLRITAQVPEGGVVASLEDMQVVSDSDEKKSYQMTYSDYTGVPSVTLGNGIHSELEYFSEALP